MINAINTQRQACFGTPSAARVRTATTAALPKSGEVAALAMVAGADVQGIAVSKHRVFTGNWALPGTSVWSPPT